MISSCNDEITHVKQKENYISGKLVKENRIVISTMGEGELK